MFAAPEPTDVSDKALGEGMSLRVWDLGESVDRLPNLVKGQTGNVNKLVPRPDLKDEDFELEDHFYAEATGYLVIEEAGDYEFELSSDDGSALILGGELLIGNDGLHTAEVSVDGFVELKPGSYFVTLRMFEGSGEAELRLRWRPPGGGTISRSSRPASGGRKRSRSAS